MKKNITNTEKNIILEMHNSEKGNKNFFNLTESEIKKLIMKVLSEQEVDTGEQNTHRYDRGQQSPGIEKFLQNPNDETVSNGLLNQLRNDPFGKGKIVVIFNGEKFKEPGAFMNKIKSDFGGGKCYQITSYEYNNRVWPLNTQITITANGVECKKQNPTPGPGPKPNPGPGPKPNPVPPVPKKRCKYKPMIPGDFNHKNEEGVRQFQKFCATRTDYWYAEYTDGTKRNCSKQDVDGKWGCCSQNCYENLKKRRYSN